MKIEAYFKDKKRLEKEYNHYVQNDLIRKETFASALVKAHLDKAKHNLKFVNKNMADKEFNDWTFVGLYYSVYHTSLALVAKKGFISKNHYATLLFLIKHYNISTKDARLIEDLMITKEDAELYTSLKEKREQASYSTGTLFRTEKINDFKEKVIDFLRKSEDIINSGS